jgi:hypothetical protein
MILFSFIICCLVSVFKCLAFMKQQFLVTHTIRNNGILSSLDSSVSNTPVIKFFCSRKCYFYLYFYKNVRCLNVDLLSIYKVSFVSCKVVYWWITTKCYSISDMCVCVCV